MRFALVPGLLLAACTAQLAEEPEQPARVPVDLPVDYYRCAVASDCAIAGDACYSCGGLSVINQKHLTEFATRYGDRTGLCTPCDTSGVELACEHGVCREARLDIESRSYRTCAQPLDCVIGLDPCAQPVALNRLMSSQFRALSHVTPWHCRRMPERTPVAVGCESGICEVHYDRVDNESVRVLGLNEIAALQEWRPYIRHGRGTPPKYVEPASQQPRTGVAKPAGT